MNVNYKTANRVNADVILTFTTSSISIKKQREAREVLLSVSVFRSRYALLH